MFSTITVLVSRIIFSDSGQILRPPFEALSKYLDIQDVLQLVRVVMINHIRVGVLYYVGNGRSASPAAINLFY